MRFGLGAGHPCRHGSRGNGVYLGGGDELGGTGGDLVGADDQLLVLPRVQHHLISRLAGRGERSQAHTLVLILFYMQSIHTATSLNYNPQLQNTATLLYYRTKRLFLLQPHLGI